MRTALIYNFLIEANLMASIAIILMIPVRMIGRKKLGNRALCFAWLLVAIRLLCPLALPNPVIHEIRSAFAQDTAIRPIAGQIQVRFGDAVGALYDSACMAGIGGSVEEALYDLREDTGNGMLSIRLMKAYLAGAGLTVGWFVLSNRRFRKQLKADRIEPISGRTKAQYEALELGNQKVHTGGDQAAGNHHDQHFCVRLHERQHLADAEERQRTLFFARVVLLIHPSTSSLERD